MGCAAYQPYEYRNERETIQGPGLLSGEDGVFSVYGRKDSKQPQDPEDASAAGEDEDEKAGAGR